MAEAQIIQLPGSGKSAVVTGNTITPVETGGGPPNNGGMVDSTESRLGKLEGALEGIRHSQNVTLAAVLGVGAILAGLFIYALQKIDQLPDEIHKITTTLSAAITATQANNPQPPAPQVIYIQPPAPPAPPPAAGPKQ